MVEPKLNYSEFLLILNKINDTLQEINASLHEIPGLLDAQNKLLVHHHHHHTNNKNHGMDRVIT